MKRVFSIAIILILFLSACGKKEDTTGTSQEQSQTGIAQTSASDNTVLNPYIAQETEGTVEVIYRNKDPKYTHEMDGFKIAVDEYEIVKVTGMNENSKILFDDQTNGYIITSKVTIENGTNKQLYYSNYHRIQLSNELDFIQSDWKNFVAEDQRINTIKQNKDDFTLFEPKEKVSGFITFALTDYEFEKLKNTSPKYIIEGGLADNSQSENSNLQKSPVFDFLITAPAQPVPEPAKPEVPADQPIFHQDKLLTENWASKKMIFEKANINKTKAMGTVKVTLDSVQYTEVIPTAGNESMFSAFGGGVAALTVKLKIDNQSAAPISLGNLGTSLDVDETRATYFTQGVVEPSEPSEIAAGQQGEKLHVFLFKKDEFDLYKKFTLNFGPINGQGDVAVFNLPR
ncbi:DUF5068 domain-containing protein [Bacillus benzoevorans]|uniref:DUF5068 domain-containing protein n=1 Tax=Bacillus benzoevorans TaxID=1456 RepID=A0A7X0HVU2_9BACI|nr:DUF5068 domain-containing protein [Bacillus benzoevorans]MBB6447814.1 hypothetical protein [Bacillus benzoevorans]